MVSVQTLMLQSEPPWLQGEPLQLYAENPLHQVPTDYRMSPLVPKLRLHSSMASPWHKVEPPCLQGKSSQFQGEPPKLQGELLRLETGQSKYDIQQGMQTEVV
jgi:hypothetical protein